MSNNLNVADDANSAEDLTEKNSGAQNDDLDSVLSRIDRDFDEGVKKVGSTDDPGQKIAALESQVESLLMKDTRSDIEDAVRLIREDLGDLPVELPSRVVRGMLNDMATEDPRVLKAFQNRRSDPGTWRKVLKATAKSISSEFTERVDSKVTGDRAALTAAIRGQSVKQDDDVEKMDRFFQNCTDREFAEFKRTKKIPDSYRA